MLAEKNNAQESMMMKEYLLPAHILYQCLRISLAFSQRAHKQNIWDDVIWDDDTGYCQRAIV